MSKRKATAAPVGRPSALIDTQVIYCGDNLVDPIYIDPPFKSNRNYEVLWGRRSEPRPLASRLFSPFDDRHASTAAYIEYMRPRCVELACVVKKTGTFA